MVNLAFALHSTFVVLAFIVCPVLGHAQQGAKTKFGVFVEKQIAEHNIRPSKKQVGSQLQRLCPIDDSRLARRVFFEYGAVFAADDVALPPTCLFEDEREVGKFHNALRISSADFSGVAIRLQEKAMKALLDAANDATVANLRITPLDGSIAGGRTYDETVRLWLSRFERALNYWNRRGAISDEEAAWAHSAIYRDQAEKVMDWEGAGRWFGTGVRRSIFSSVAPPGGSQHLMLLAFDVVEYENAETVAVLNRHGWFQTIVGDGPHFTYLGVKADKLPSRGLRFLYSGNVGYWVPDTTPITNAVR